MPEPMQVQFSAWLSPQRACGLAGNPEAGPKSGAFTFQENRDCSTIIRVRKNTDFFYLYCQRYNSGGITRSGDFEYAGIYCGRDGMVYDDQYNIRPLRHDELMREGAQQMLLRLKADVRQAVEAAIGNDRSNLRITELSNQRDRDSLENHIEYNASSEARRLFLNDDDSKAIAYSCFYDPPCWTEDSLLEYILDPEGYTAREAVIYIGSHQEAILYDFLTADATAAEYRAIVKNLQHQAHRVKRIMQAMSATTAKTVRVTICKNDVEFTFKTEADAFRRDCGSHYSTWKIALADRREFERLYGRSAVYGPEDILLIEYGRSVIYEA